MVCHPEQLREDDGHADVRLAPWILTQEPLEFRIEAVDASGDPVPALRLQLLDDSFEHQASPFQSPWDSSIALPVNSTRAMLSATGFRSLELVLLPGKQKIVMHPGIPVRFHLENPPLIPPGVRLATWIHWETAQIRDQATHQDWQDLTFLLQEPGRHRVKIALVADEDSPESSASLMVVDQWFELEDQVGEQVIRLELDPERWEAALSALGL